MLREMVLTATESGAGNFYGLVRLQALRYSLTETIAEVEVGRVVGDVGEEGVWDSFRKFNHLIRGSGHEEVLEIDSEVGRENYILDALVTSGKVGAGTKRDQSDIV